MIRPEHRYTQQKQKQQIHHDESAAAVLTCHPWEFPDITNPNSAAGTEQDEAQTAGQSFSFHIDSSNWRQMDQLYGDMHKKSIYFLCKK